MGRPRERRLSVLSFEFCCFDRPHSLGVSGEFLFFEGLECFVPCRPVGHRNGAYVFNQYRQPGPSGRPTSIDHSLLALPLAATQYASFTPHTEPGGPIKPPGPAFVTAYRTALFLCCDGPPVTPQFELPVVTLDSINQRGGSARP